LKLSILALIRWVLSDDQRTGRAIRLTIVAAVAALLICYGIALLVATSNAGWPVGTLAAASGGIGVALKKRKRRADH
jgi:hypothetical protein